MRQKFLSVIILIGYTYLQSTAQNRIVLDLSKAKDTINKNIYGHFSEHLGRCIYDGFYVGENNKIIPNKKGIRLDIMEALKKLKIPVLRCPDQQQYETALRYYYKWSS